VRGPTEKAWSIVTGGLILDVRLTPRGGRDAVEGIETRADDCAVLRARVRAAALEGEANAALLRLIADALGVAPRTVTLAGGAKARVKRLKIAGDGAALGATLDRFAGGG
jgi:hypothetical protein